MPSTEKRKFRGFALQGAIAGWLVLSLGGPCPPAGLAAEPKAEKPKADKPKAEKPKADKPESPALPDKITLADGKVLEGSLFDVTEKKVVIEAGGEKKTFLRDKVKDIQRGARKEVLQFFQTTFDKYLKSGTVKQWRQLADWCQKKQVQPERRKALRELVRVDPADAEAHTELGHALLEGRWLDEEETEAKLKEGYEVSGGKLVKRTVTVVKKDAPPAAGYKIMERKKLTPTQRATLERDRAQRLKSAEKYLALKQKEYEGIAWEDRHIIKTAHFEIHCNSTMNVAGAYAKLMEAIRDKHAKMFQSRVLRNLRAPVFIYASQEDFISKNELGRWAGRGLGGYYRPDNQSINVYHGTFGFTATTFNVLCHEATHYYEGLVLNQFSNVPMWLIEGLAVYFGDGSIFDPKAGKIETGLIPRDRLAHIQEKMLSKSHTPVEKLVTLQRGQFSGSHYADSWALIYFLVNSGKKGKDLLTEYWAIGLNRAIEKKDFKVLAEKYFGSIGNLDKQYVDYVLKLDMPSAGQVVGDYFTSDVFQFDFKAPGENWQFFEDRDDKKLLVGLMVPGTTAEIRIYYDNNLENAKSDELFPKFLEHAQRAYKDLQHEPVKISNLNGYKLSYVDDRKASDLITGELSIMMAYNDQASSMTLPRKKKKENEGPRQFVRFLLILEDGIVSIECFTEKGKDAGFDETFAKANELFTLTFTRRW
jgi:hypothetical protein